MKISLLTLLLILTFSSFGQQKNAGLANELFRAGTDSIYDKLVSIRRDFHRNPELAGREIRTQEAIKQYLLNLGIEVKTDVYGHGIIGIINSGKKGKNIAWRTEMDALPNNFPDSVGFRSIVEGVQHGCGHDVHLAIALGIAEILAKHKKSLHGTVYFIFQPEEETFVGAKNMIASGLFSKIHPDEIYGLHVTDLPVGKIVVKPNEMFAYQRRIRVELKNKLSKEQVQKLAQKIHSSLSRSQINAKPWEIGRMIDPDVGLINSKTIFSDYLIMDDDFSIYTQNGKLFLEAYLYETNRSNIQKIIPKVKQLIAREKYQEKLLSVSFIQENPTVINNEKLTKRAINIITEVYGNTLVTPDFGQVPYFNDDFAYFQQRVPGVYFFLGASNTEKGIIALNHTPGFNVDEECIKVGVRSFSALIVNRLNEE